MFLDLDLDFGIWYALWGANILCGLLLSDSTVPVEGLFMEKYMSGLCL